METETLEFGKFIVFVSAIIVLTFVVSTAIFALA